MGDRINFSSCINTTRFVRLLFSMYFIVSILTIVIHRKYSNNCNVKYQMNVSNCIYLAQSILENVCLSCINCKFWLQQGNRMNKM